MIGVVPAAGHATRLQPLKGSKEVLVLNGRPVMHLLVERMRAAGCSDIRVVTRPEKTDVIAEASGLGLTVVLARPPSVSASLLVGIGPAADDDEIVLFGFPDTLWEPEDGFARLLPPLDHDYVISLGIFTFAEPERSDVVALSPDGSVASVSVKPTQPADNLVWGCAAARVHVLRELAATKEPEPGRYFDHLARRGLVAGVRLSSYFVDVGTKEALDRMRRAEPNKTPID